jgi:hypothetical protein
LAIQQRPHNAARLAGPETQSPVQCERTAVGAVALVMTELPMVDVEHCEHDPSVSN